MFRAILIANRGEIACRVIRTARGMGVRAVAVFSDADRDAPHVSMADEAYPIGPAPARESYLRIDRIIEAARASRAEAIHPGYGFLSENAEFAEACASAEIVFIGPPPGAIRAMGSKSAAKSLMERAGVPLVPGYHGEAQDASRLAEEAARVGYPVLIKASAGGGGKGMRVVERAADFAGALALAQGEARASFGDDRVLIERYLERPRHIEMQVFADGHGNVVHLFERDCSIQRRYQKVMEEAPAPGMTPERRAAMARAACDAARAIGYQGAGTIEFIAEGDAFYFMEMNTRLQVEHPVTEMVTGLDLVEWQLRVAAGEKLPLAQDAIRLTGHAIEARIYAEDPARDYMPSTGFLRRLRFPTPSSHVRTDAGVQEGGAVTIHYDPMIAKLIAWDTTRADAIRRLQAALADCEVVGVRTNLGLLRRVATNPDFADAAEFDTGFLARHPAMLAPAEAAAPALAFAAIAARLAADLAEAAHRTSTDPHSPWALASAWRLNGVGRQEFVLQDDEGAHTVRATPRQDGAVVVECPGGTLAVRRGPIDALVVDGVHRRVPVQRSGDALTAIIDGTPWRFTLADPLTPPQAEGAGGDRVISPMPGRIVSVHAEPGTTVARGDLLVVLEAMKVQMRLTAPRDATVKAVHVARDQLVEEGTELVGFVIAPAT